MAKIIKCDFRRTERHKEMHELEVTLQKMLDAFNYPNECELPCSADEAIRITNRYTELQNEEKEWGMCHLWK